MARLRQGRGRQTHRVPAEVCIQACCPEGKYCQNAVALLHALSAKESLFLTAPNPSLELFLFSAANAETRVRQGDVQLRCGSAGATLLSYTHLRQHTSPPSFAKTSPFLGRLRFYFGFIIAYLCVSAHLWGVYLIFTSLDTTQH